MYLFRLGVMKKKLMKGISLTAKRPSNNKKEVLF